jgi:phage portal protein BeeE
MTSLIRRVTTKASETRDATITLGQYAEMLQYGGLNYDVTGGGTLGGKTEDIASDFQGYVQGAYQSNGVVFACITARMLLFSEARFQYQRLRNGRPGDLFGTPELAILERPWPDGTTGDLLSRALQDADLGGNAYVHRPSKDRLVRMRPDWVTIILGSMRRDWEPGDLDTEVAGYLYHPGGRSSSRDPVGLLPETVAHWAPIPDPGASYRGMSWITPLVDEIRGDQSAMTHKLQFFDNGATVNLVATLPPEVQTEAFNRWVALFNAGHKGKLSAYETVFLGGGADLKAIGSDMKQIDFKEVQGHGETRVCAAARVPPIIVGLSEGLDAATYANYGQARRAFADGTMRPLWRSMSGALATIVKREPAARLWTDQRDIPFLQEDVADEANIQQVRAIAIRQLVEAGFEPDSVVAAIESDDYSLLIHSGWYSIQLQAPGTVAPLEAPAVPPVAGD